MTPEPRAPSRGSGQAGRLRFLATCSLGTSGLSFITAYGVLGGYVGAPSGAIHMDNSTNSALLLNLACVFTPSGPPPTTYTLSVY